MSVTLDANLLLYASDTESPRQERALEVLREHTEGSQILYLFWPVAMAYLRIATHPAVFDNPLSPAEAMAHLQALLARSNVRTPGEDQGFWGAFQAITEKTVVRANLVTDAHIVALMHIYGVRTILTSDRDFHKFDDVEVRNPFE